MGDDPSPGQVEEVKVEVNLDTGEQGFAEAPRDPAEEASQLDPLDLTGSGEDSPDWEAPEDEVVLALGDRLPRTRGQRAGVKAQRQRAFKAAAIARAEEGAEAADAAGRQLRAPAAAPREARASAAAAAAGAGTQRAPSRPAPKFLAREQAELRHAGRSRSPADDRQEADRPRRPPSRRRQPSARRPESGPVYTERTDPDYIYADYRDQRNRGQYRGPDYGTAPAAKASRRRESSRPAQPPLRTQSPSLARPGKRWTPKVRSGPVRAPSSPSQEPVVSQLSSASGSGTVRVSAASARPRGQSVSFGDRPEPKTPEEEPVQDLAYLEAQAELANARVSAAREAARAAAEEKARLGIDRAIDHALRLDKLRQLIRAADPDRPDDPRRPVSPLPADIESSLRNCSAERLAELAASFQQIPAAASARVQTPPPPAAKAAPPRLAAPAAPDPGDQWHPDWRDPVTGQRFDPWAAAAKKVIPARETYVDVAAKAASAPSLASGSSSAASSAEGPAGRGLQLLAQPTTQRPYRVVVDFHNVLDIGPPEGAIPVSLAPAFRSLQAEFPRLEFEVLSFCTTRDRRNEVHRRCNQFEQLVSGGGARRPIFAAVATCDERTGKPQWNTVCVGQRRKRFPLLLPPV
ncbi:unnamed protein product [Polarella glacialis]|uniref:Uncharacterized protein n=1 Tax=Polarella glacialis TaxID=89957 RepID=A0A813KBU6_POLGL|nr:unnamed protein product [Polarella glacialis]